MKQWVKISALLFSSQVLLMAHAVGAEGDAVAGADGGSAVVDACPNDKDALVALYDGLDGDNWKKGGPSDNDLALRWKTGPDHCEWFGVECDAAGKVISIDLNANKLSGSIPEAIGDLGCLQTLNLDDNSIAGSIPTTITRVGSLQRLSIDANKIQGNIPSALADMTNLLSVDFDYNALHVAADAPAGTATSLEQKHGSNFLTTQTLDAQNAAVTARTRASLTLEWEQVGFAPKGGYRIYMATNKKGPFEWHKNISGTGVDLATGQVNGKTNTSAEVKGLKAGTRYYFVVHSFTNPHADNRNEVESDGLTGNVAEGITDSDDSDLDGILNVDEERIGTDPNNPDSDRDGIFDRVEADPLNPANTDKDALIDALDPDDDNDGIPTRSEVIIPEDASKSAEFKDSDGDKTFDHLDTDDDNDGVPTLVEVDGGANLQKDTDGDGILDYLDTDDDNDGVSTYDETDKGANIEKDSDEDGIPDYLDATNDKVAVLGDTADRVDTSIGGGSAGLGIAVAGLLGLVRRRRLMAAAAVAPLLIASGTISAADQAATDAKDSTAAAAEKAASKTNTVKAAEKGSEETAPALKNEQVDFVIQQSQPERGGRIYLGLGAGMSTLDPEIIEGSNTSVSDDNDAGYKFLFGYEATDHLAIEAMVASLGAAKLSPDNADVDYKVGSLFALYNMFDYRVGLNPIIKVGIASIDNSASPGIDDNKVDDATLAGGLGLEYEFSNGFVVRGEYEYYAEDAQMASLSIIKRLGGEPPIVIPAPAPQPVAAPTPPSQVNVAPPSVQVEFKIPDTDGDGVNDIRDACPNTPAGAEVDEVGCAKFQGVLRGVNFEYNSARLTPRARQILDEVAEELKNYPSVRVEVQAHTDSKGSSGYNLWLSERRAQSVIDYLVSLGISRARLVPIGFGETKPIASNATEQGRALNRRVEFKVIPQR